MQTLLGKQWHHLLADQAGELLNTDLENGLDAFEVQHLDSYRNSAIL